MVVAAPCAWHEHHELAAAAARDVEALPAQVLLETVSVMTRLPSGLAQPLDLVSDALARSFPGRLLPLPPEGYGAMLAALARAGLRGGAVYDALIATTTNHHGAALLSLDRRAAATYPAVGARVEVPA